MITSLLPHHRRPTTMAATISTGRSGPLLTRPGRRGAHPVVVLLVVLALVGGVFAPTARAEEPRGIWEWPLAGPHEVASRFDPPAQTWGAGHRGIDVIGGGDEVRAVDGGVVHFSGSIAGRGVVSIRHDNGLISSYEPLHSSVRQGDRVASGDVIGKLGGEASMSHCAPRMCLHLGARRDQQYVDPLLLLGARGPSVLLPLGGVGPGQGSVLGGNAPAPLPATPSGSASAGSSSTADPGGIGRGPSIG
ncbi:MAG: M23 family metallopeptidase [Brachybacterium sp.]|nr:M23 family metallopeptidase [Brachybacterium sp.]